MIVRHKVGDIRDQQQTQRKRTKLKNFAELADEMNMRSGGVATMHIELRKEGHNTATGSGGPVAKS